MIADAQHISILKFVHQKGGTGNVMEALGWEVAKHEEGFRLALELENLNYAKLLYSNFNKNLIVLELTLVGIEAVKKFNPAVG
ncbi:MAG: hypothetical protein JST48_09885 [Bacteroidetes bacterium]|nr:hypothetical protein [Bacteroidota bacterium]